MTQAELEAQAARYDVPVPKPCPFCDGVPTFLEGHNHIIDVMIRCTGCGAEGPLCDDEEVSNAAFNAGAAVAHWNMRAATCSNG